VHLTVEDHAPVVDVVVDVPWSTKPGGNRPMIAMKPLSPSL
jgi:hypothetical protein